jgi:hypothetical protein
MFSFNKKKSEESAKGKTWLKYALISFLLIGCNQLLSTIPSHWAGWEDSLNLRIPLAQGGAFLFQAVVFLVLRKKLSKKIVYYAVLQSILITAGQKLLYVSMDLLNAAAISL